MKRLMREQNLDRWLPLEAINKGYSLVWYPPEWQRTDPTILFYRGDEVYRWVYDPSMGEVWDKIKEVDR